MRKPIKGLEGLYEIGDDGLVYTLPRKLPTPTCVYYRNKETSSKGFKDKKGYLRFDFRRRGGKVVPVHRLVAEAFVPNPDNKQQVNHINGNKEDNRAINLEWVNNSENQIHAFSNGLQKGGCSHHNSVLTYEQVKYIKTHYKKNVKGCGARYLAKKFDVSVGTIFQIIKGKSYKNI